MAREKKCAFVAEHSKKPRVSLRQRGGRRSKLQIKIGSSYRGGGQPLRKIGWKAIGYYTIREKEKSEVCEKGG